MFEKKWNGNWNFWEEKNAFALVWDIPEDVTKVDLPHDAMMANGFNPESRGGTATGFRDGGCYIYEKNLYIEEDADREIRLRFDGVYQKAMVYLNEQLVGKDAGGYRTFICDLKNYIHAGNNSVRVLVRNTDRNSRWYPGSGIYRDVFLLTSGPVYLEPGSLKVTTEDADEALAVLRIEADVTNHTNRPVSLTVRSSLSGKPENKGSSLEGCENENNKENVCRNVLPAHECDSQLVVPAGETVHCVQRITLRQPMLWSDASPALYGVSLKLFNGQKECLDADSAVTGIRTLALDAVRGLRVNGRTVKLRGACIHHDEGVLGAACYYDAEYRRMKFLKEAGFNAVRMSHHPAADVLLRAADETGMYVMDELSDMWNRPKSSFDHALDFEEWWEKDLTAAVVKDYNHPSVILYSLGNEIPEIGTVQGSNFLRKMSGRLKELDATRYSLAAINGVFAAGDKIGEIMQDLKAGGDASGNVNDFMSMMDQRMDDIVNHKAVSDRIAMAAASLDIVGYNYMTARYEKDHGQYPDRLIVGSETYPPKIAENWEKVTALSTVIGDFTWTGWDYIGEAGIGIPAYRFGEGGFGAGYPCKLAYAGDFDLTGFRRPASYFREAVFGRTNIPYIAVQNPFRYGEPLFVTPWVMSDAVSSWSYPGAEGKKAVVEVYADGDETELFLNGRSLGKKTAGKDAGFRTIFETVYEPGTLLSVNYKDGKEIGRYSLETAGAYERINIVREDTAREDGLIYLELNLADAAGRTVTSLRKKLTIKVEGGRLMGMGSADPKTEDLYPSGSCFTWNGRAIAVIRKEDKETSVTVCDDEGRTTKLLII
ncbi:MAG TPA: glycoside hydrolase family 2 TIM barrel-domain containing protein [Lachnospiraceae bacterium]|nr:glycoside hydrolase family 2 TIM barrel-domain containing protein [Lachnospiraceae bacterium]